VDERQRFLYDLLNGTVEDLDEAVRQYVESWGLVNLSDAARIIGVSRARVRQVTKQGRLTPALHVSGAPAYRRADVERFKESGRLAPYRPRKTDTAQRAETQDTER
jgi:hypothetical protein